MSDDPLTLDALLALEQRGWESLTRHEGGRFYGALMTADAVMILVNGMVLDRETIAATLDDSPAWSTFTLEDARLVSTGQASAALVYRATAARDGEDEPFVALMSSHYTLVDGETALMLYQQTTVTH
ncbi:nuclear transport factor 2 family protein [Brachybacterium paraconglomeratum]|uniref:nuclear transport factor 2 family protein n=1 Tax=Brachybacterium paraconglomeratum TaxID=173362 RepID=UPI0022AE8B2D|nr:nuclear transport factor 2 family protein [Brachybacterium paraconglomeratum]MCZ4326287.1 nuclear transport factor 2 family protein [Brachybacterium paraconglomeratum]